MPLSPEILNQVVGIAEKDVVEGFQAMLEPVSDDRSFDVVLPDSDLPVDQVVTASDQVIAVPWVFHARHVGSFLGVPATYQPVDLAGTTFITKPGDDESEWTYTRYIDFLGALNQMGVSVVTRPALTPDEFQLYREQARS